jgi:hypothetical protein
MADPSGDYDLVALFLGQSTISIRVDPATSEVTGMLGTGPDAVAISGKWDDTNSRISFNDAFEPGDIISTHFFEGSVSSEEYTQISGLAGTYQDLSIHVSGGRISLAADNGGWCASRNIIG